jgi:ubiquinone/menaquinone biosynthesis C-methylase UbiE
MGNDPYRFYVRFYDRIFEPVNRGLWSKGLDMLDPDQGMSVLDVGCGTGSQLALYQKQGCQVSGIDLSPAMLSVAGNRLGAGADLRLADATSMPFSDGSFDVVLSMLVLHEMSPRVRAETLREARRVLKPEGRMLIIDFHAGPPKRSLKGLANRAFRFVSELCAGREHFSNYKSFVAAGGMPRLTEAEGLAVVDQRIVGGGNMGLYLLGVQQPAERA